MSVQIEDLEEPTGELNLGLLFPDKTTSQAEDDVQTWIDLAASELAVAGIIDQDTIDRSTRAYVYFRAYKSVYQRLSSTPISKNLSQDGISVSMTQGQIDSFREKYITWERVWAQGIESTQTADIITPATIAVKTEVGF